jgi:hypothetical protein
MHKNATKCNETIGKWCKNKHGASKIIDTFETYQICIIYVMHHSKRNLTPMICYHTMVPVPTILGHQPPWLLTTNQVDYESRTFALNAVVI